MIAVYALLVRRMEHRNANEIAHRNAAPSLLSGVLIGAGLIGLVFIILSGLGVARFHAGTGLKGLTVAVLMPAVVGILEELVFRVILFRILEHIGGTLAAVVVSAGLFGLAHAANPGATPLAITFLTVELGVFLALVYTMTQSLWMVAGVHMSWNFMQGFVFGSDVSGLQPSSGIMRTSLDGPDWLTGGAFGLEGSIVTLGVSLVGILIVVSLIVRQKRWQPRKFELRARSAAH
jgi:membrane protease YdiL (CAAX protease family)